MYCHGALHAQSVLSNLLSNHFALISGSSYARFDSNTASLIEFLMSQILLILNPTYLVLSRICVFLLEESTWLSRAKAGMAVSTSSFPLSLGNEHSNIRAINNCDPDLLAELCEESCREEFPDNPSSFCLFDQAENWNPGPPSGSELCNMPNHFKTRVISSFYGCWNLADAVPFPFFCAWESRARYWHDAVCFQSSTRPTWKRNHWKKCSQYQFANRSFFDATGRTRSMNRRFLWGWTMQRGK